MQGAPGATSSVRIGVLSFELHHADQTISIMQADPLIEITDQVLEQADERYVSVGDGIITFHADNGDISYGLKEHDELRECWLALRSGVTDEDLE